MFFLLLSLFTTSYLPQDTIHNVSETTNSLPMLHSSGLFTYGAHTNTFHLRYAYLKVEHQMPSWQWWITLRGYADTHIPETNYGYILNNLSLYDYGIEKEKWGFFVSFRGAAIPRWNTQSFLLVPFAVRKDNPGEFDRSAWYLEEPVNASGIRLGWKSTWGYFSYSQGDYRHLIPMGITAHLFLPWIQWRNTLIIYNGEPETYALSDYHFQGQTSLSSSMDLTPIRVLLLGEGTYQQRSQRIGIRLEQALRWKNFQIGCRQIWWENLGWNIETGVLVWIGKDTLSLGFQFSTEGRSYFGAKVDF
ncbi:MAG: hypothetical protein N2314_00950 [Brevinematales bacterium]|nr:hypothetical protein [Brevinematales bacterium]